jgi:hypothetical protein
VTVSVTAFFTVMAIVVILITKFPIVFMVTVLTLPKLPVFLWLLRSRRWLRLHIQAGKIRERTHQQFYALRRYSELFLLVFVLSFWIIFHSNILRRPIPVATGSKAWVCGRWLAGIAVQMRPVEWMSVSCEWCGFQVEISATGRSLVQRSPS